MDSELSDIINNVPQMIWKIKVSATNKIDIIFRNKKWRDYADNKDIFDKTLLHPEEIEYLNKLWLESLPKKKFQVERRLKDLFGNYRWFLTRAVCIKDNIWLGTCTDIQEIKERRTENTLIQQKTESSRVLLSIMAKKLENEAVQNQTDKDLAETTRLSLAIGAKKLANTAIENQNEKVLAETTRVSLAIDAEKLANEKEIAETTRVSLAIDAEKLANDAVENQNEKKLAETTRVSLAINARKLANTAIENQNQKVLAETTRVSLAIDAQKLANTAIENQNQKVLAETARVSLAIDAEKLANTAIENQNQKVLAETARVSLAIDADALAKQADLAEITRIELSKKAEILATDVLEKEIQKNIAETTRLKLSENAKVLAKTATSTHQTILQMQLEKMLADQEIVKRELEKKQSDKDLESVSREAKKLSDQVILQIVADQQLKIIINSIPVILWVVDKTGVFTMSEGKGLIELFEIPGKLVGTNIYDYFDEKEQNCIKDSMEGKTTSNQVHFKNRDYEIFYTPLNFNTGIIGVIILARDITDQKKLETEKTEIILREQAALQNAEIKTNFLANMSHEIRTPLYGMLSYVEFLLETNLNSVQREYTETLFKSVSYLTVIVNDILEISKLEKNKIVLEENVFDPSRCILDVTLILKHSATAKDLEFKTEFSKDLPTRVVGDANRFQQVLVSLINNAIKFTEKGEIKVVVDCIPLDSVNSTKIKVEIIDTGIGMDDETLNRLFKLFSQADDSSTRAHGGTGLGLYISSKLARCMSGGIEVKSIKNKGTTITFTSIMKLTAPPSMTRENMSNKPLLNLNILIVEDNIINQKIINKTLSRAGANVTTAENGLIGLEIWKNHRNFDLILMDCHMPIMDGYDCTIELRKENCIIPILALTANAMPENIKICHDAGMNDTITKPVKPSDLVHKILDWTSLRKNL